MEKNRESIYIFIIKIFGISGIFGISRKLKERYIEIFNV